MRPSVLFVSAQHVCLFWAWLAVCMWVFVVAECARVPTENAYSGNIAS